MEKRRLLVYGAYGYTGELISRAAAEQGLDPILSGRDAGRVESLAAELGVAARPFGLGSGDIAAHLDDVAVVVHCAGPFVDTAAPMVTACLAAGAHYLDITGEIDVFEDVFARSEAAREAGVVLCPGAGFDVVPTDCVAARLAEEMPDAVRLDLGWEMELDLSPGTAKTTVRGLAQGGRRRVGGRIETVPLALDDRTIDFGGGPTTATTIAWGDVSTAYRSTGIPDIVCWAATPPGLIAQYRRLDRIRGLLALAPVRALALAVAGRTRGPDAEALASGTTRVWGEVHDEAGATRVARLSLGNPYQLTVDSSLALARRLLEDPPAEGGTCTPSQLMGWRFVEGLPGCSPITVTSSQPN
jgi:short subunit dehydrogenase-like uncharacterized protein